MQLFVVVISALFVAAYAVPTPDARDNEVTPPESIWSRIGREFGKCTNAADTIGCVAAKTITAIHRAARQQSIDVIPGFSLVRTVPYSNRDGKALSENEIEASMPATLSEKTAKLLDLLVDATSSFLNTHTIQVKLPAETTQELGRALEEGRKKMKKMKMMGPMMMMLGAKLMMFLPIAIIVTKLIAVKALIIAKIALILALIGSAGSLGSIFSKGGGGHGGGHGGSGWSSGGASYAPSGGAGWSAGGGGPYRRSLSETGDAHDMAYSAQ